MTRDKSKDLRKLAKLFMRHYEMLDGDDFPGLNQKRPFGNSNWMDDIMEELHIDTGAQCPHCGNLIDEAEQMEAESYVRDLFTLLPQHLYDLSGKIPD